MKTHALIRLLPAMLWTAAVAHAGNITIDGELTVASNSVKFLRGTNLPVTLRTAPSGSLQRVGPGAATNAVWDAGNDGQGSGLDADRLDGFDATNFWRTSGNTGTDAGQPFLGTTDRAPLQFRVNNLVGLRLEPASVPNLLGGGRENIVDTNTYGAVIAGGNRNTIHSNALYSSVLGGFSNVVGVGARFSVAAGRRAKANHAGSFVWADTTEADLQSTAPNQFLIRASGGVGIGTNNTAGAALRVSGPVVVHGPLVVAEPAGDIPMGDFTAGKP